MNVPALVRKLQDFDYQQDWYLGKPSIPEPLEILDRDNMQVQIILHLIFLTSHFPRNGALSVAKIQTQSIHFVIIQITIFVHKNQISMNPVHLEFFRCKIKHRKK